MRKKLTEKQKSLIWYHNRQIEYLEYKIQKHKEEIEKIKKDENYENNNGVI